MSHGIFSPFFLLTCDRVVGGHRVGQRALPSLLQGLEHSCRCPLLPSCNLTVWAGSTFCSCYPLVTAEEERRRREITGLLATRGCKAGPTGGGRRGRPRASSCAGDSRAGWPVRKVGPGWLAARPHNAPPPAPHPPPALLLSAAAASTDYPAAPAAAAGSLLSSCSNSHPPPAACAALSQLQPELSLPVRVETYATHTSSHSAAK